MNTPNLKLVPPSSDQPQARKLLDQVRDKIRLKHYSIRTEQAYVDWARRFVLFHGKRHPASMGAREVEGFLTHLAVEGKFHTPPRLGLGEMSMLRAWAILSCP